MKTQIIKTAKSLKGIERKLITEINDVKFGEIYPMLEISNKHASYYNVEKQENTPLFTPFTVTLKN